jgi:hypothetical protein
MKKPAAITVIIILLILIAVIATLKRPTQYAAGTTYYVSLTGSNSNNGSVNSPWRNLNYASARLQAGDSLCVGAGVWNNGNDIFDSQYYTVNSGTSYSAPITIGGCNGEVPTIKPPAWYGAIKLTWTSPHYIIFHDMRLDGSNQANSIDHPDLVYFSDGSHHIKLERMIVEHTMTNALHWSTNNVAPDFHTAYELRDSLIQDVGNATADSGHGGPGINNGYGIYMFTGGNTIYGNAFTDMKGIGLVVYGPDNTIDSNRFYNTGVRGGPAPAINFGSSSNPVPTTNGLFINNLVYNNRVGGLQVYTNSTVFAYNNTFYNNPFSVHAQYCVAGTLQNNLFSDVELVNDSPSTCKITMDHNLNSQTSDIKFINPEQGDFRLSSIDSAAYNKGLIIDRVTHDFTGTVTRPQEVLADIGAYEFVKEGEVIKPVDSTDKVVLLGAEVTTITNKSALVKTLVCHNPNGARSYVQLFNIKGTTKAGSTEPIQSYGIPPNDTLPLTGLGLAFANQLGAAATTTVMGTTAPGVKVSCNFGMVVEN